LMHFLILLNLDCNLLTYYIVKQDFVFEDDVTIILVTTVTPISRYIFDFF